MIKQIYESNGTFTGGIVRDYLLLGEMFNDVDFYFNTEPKWIYEWANNHQKFWMVKDCVTYHCQKVPFNWDLSCNLFNFSKERGIFAKPSIHKFNYEVAFEMLLNKRFVLLHKFAINLKFKMIARGWVAEPSFYETQEEQAPKHGSWEQYSEIASERMKALFDTSPKA
jgi:hypothetical protein